MEQSDFLLESYSYELPESSIAQVPAHPAESAKMLIWNQGKSSIVDSHFYELPSMLSDKDVLICNNTNKPELEVFTIKFDDPYERLFYIIKNCKHKFPKDFEELSIRLLEVKKFVLVL